MTWATPSASRSSWNGADRQAVEGLGSGVLEIVESQRRNAYRAVYTVRFEKAIYVLHAFSKKSPVRYSEQASATSVWSQNA